MCVSVNVCVSVYAHGGKHACVCVLKTISSHLSPLARLAVLKCGSAVENVLIKCLQCGKV